MHHTMSLNIINTIPYQSIEEIVEGIIICERHAYGFVCIVTACACMLYYYNIIITLTYLELLTTVIFPGSH